MHFFLSIAAANFFFCIKFIAFACNSDFAFCTFLIDFFRRMQTRADQKKIFVEQTLENRVNFLLGFEQLENRLVLGKMDAETENL